MRKQRQRIFYYMIKKIKTIAIVSYICFGFVVVAFPSRIVVSQIVACRILASRRWSSLASASGILQSLSNSVWYSFFCLFQFRFYLCAIIWACFLFSVVFLIFLFCFAVYICLVNFLLYLV